MKDLFKLLAAYGESGVYPVHMPGHKRNTFRFPCPGNPYGLDITEIEGFDDLHEPEGILRDCMDRAARVFGAEESFFLVNGSTVGILAGIGAAAPAGSKVLMARNCHKSVYNALILHRLNPVYLYPPFVKNTGIFGSVRPEDVEQALNEESFALVVLTSPTYEGVVSDVRRIAEICRRHGVPLLVDEAHGAHLGFHPAFPESARSSGADLVVESLHKTLPSFTQTALLHRQGNLISGRRVKQQLDMLQTSSPSYLLMASIDRCVSFLEKEGEECFDSWASSLRGILPPLGRMKGLKLLTGEPEEIFAFDPSKLVISVPAGHTGPELARLLREKYRFETEMSAPDYVIAMTGAGDEWEALARFAEALLEIDEIWQKEAEYGAAPAHFPAGTREASAFLPWEAAEMEGESVPFDRQAAGQIALEFAYIYPPGVPLLVPGEVITEEIIDAAENCVRAGIPLRGMEARGKIRTVEKGKEKW